MTGYAHATLAEDEGPALGAAILAMVGTGAYPTVADACRYIIQTVATSPPQAEAQRAYQKFYPIYRALYPALKDQFAAVSQAVSA